MPNRPNPSLDPRVVLLACDRLSIFEYGIAAEIFGLPRPELGAHWYRLAVAAIDDEPVRGHAGVVVYADGGLELFERAGTIVIPGWKGLDIAVPESLCSALRRAHRRGARVLSICSGAFVLAASGLLDGRRATTHWRYADALARSWPKVIVEPDVLYIDHGDVLTSAGSAAGIDACLHLVRRDHGAQVANHVARRLVVPPHRDGGQAQYIERPVSKVRENSSLGGLLDWMRLRIDEALPIARLARRMSMSTRTFLRRFKETTGMSPGEWLIVERIGRARELLESGRHSVDFIADRSGFVTAATLRHHFRRRVGTTPSAYRARFRH